MIERKFLSQRLKEFQVQRYIAEKLTNSGQCAVEIKRTPMGEKVIVYTTRPGVVVGKKGENIKKLTLTLKKRFKMENPQVEIGEVEHPLLNPKYVADQIAYTFERYGPRRFKSLGYDMLSKMMEAGAVGAEVVIGGRGVPGQRAKSWRFTIGHLKKSGDISESFVLRATSYAHLRTGKVGIKVKIMPPGIPLPDRIFLKKKEQPKIEAPVQAPAAEEAPSEGAGTEVPEGEMAKAAPKKKTSRKKAETAEAPKASKKRASRKKADKAESPADDSPVEPQTDDKSNVKEEPDADHQAE